MTVAELIKALGGTAEVATQIGVRPSAVSQWIEKGAIPPRRVFAVWRLAREKRVDWTPPGAPVAAGAA